MSKLLDLAFYNPTQLKDEDFLRGFVARQELVDKILARLGEITPTNLAQHRLIVGQRGMGKTSLLRRIAIGVRDTPTLANVLLPLSFREEQYNVHNLHIFWCNCLDALGDWLEDSGQHNLAEQLDREVAALAGRDDDDEGSAALAVFKAWRQRQGKRPLLLLDNIDLIFNGLKDKQWSLRRNLQEAGGIVVIGASANFLEATAAPTAAFYDFFQVDVLEKLGREEVLASLRKLAEARGEAGKKVLAVLARDPGRIHTLYDLTGGNPRTLVMLYLMLEASDDGDLMRDLERLLDQVTPLYKARVEDLASQTRVVFDAVGLAWNPVTAADTAAASGLETATVSTQLDRLTRDGILEKVGLSTTSRTGFQVSERFFNIWYLMRHASRRQRSRLRWLTEFLRKFYSPQELGEMAGALIRLGADRLTRSTYCLALSDAVDDQELQNTLRFEARQELERHATETGIPLESLADPTELYTPQNALEWAKHGRTLYTLGAYEKAETAYRQAIQFDPKYTRPWFGLGNLLAHLGRYEEAETAYRQAIQLDPKYAGFWNNLGNLLQHNLSRYEEAETAYRRAIELDPKRAFPWNGLGNLLKAHLSRYEEAETAYRRAIELDPKYDRPWFGLGSLLAHLTRYEEAETAFRRASELDPKAAYHWNGLGNLLQFHLGRYEEAETAYRRASELDPKSAFPWNGLGNLLQFHLDRYEEAEAAYRQALKLDPKFSDAWYSLGTLLQNHLSRYEEAEAAYRQAIEFDPNSAYSWNNLGTLLQDHPSRYEEAEAAFRQAIEHDPKSAYPLGNLAYLLLSQPDRKNEAEACYRKAIAQLPVHGANLLQAFHALAQDNFGKSTKLLKTVLEEGHQELFTIYHDDLLRVLSLTAQRGYGDKLLAWLDESGLHDRYWPLYAAFDAYLHGKERLGDVNPEVRGAASRIYDWLASSRPTTDNKAPAVKQPKKRTKRSRRNVP